MGGNTKLKGVLQEGAGEMSMKENMADKEKQKTHKLLVSEIYGYLRRMEKETIEKKEPKCKCRLEEVESFGFCQVFKNGNSIINGRVLPHRRY